MPSDPPSIASAGFEALPVEVAVVATDGTIVLVNDAWRRFADENHGLDPDHWVGQNYLEISSRAFDDADATAAVDGLRSILEGSDEAFRLDYPCHSPTERRWFTLDAAGFVLDGERYALVVHKEITRQKIAELESTARETQLETLLAVLTHDIRNPLNIIQGYADRLAEEIGESEEIDRIRRAAIRIADISEATIEFTRSGALSDVDPFRVSELARDAWDTVATGDATLTVHETPTIYGDRRLLRQLLENLFRNSVEHGSTESRPEAGDSVEHGSTDNRRAERAGDSVEHGSTNSRPKADDSVEHGSTDSRPEAGDNEGSEIPRTTGEAGDSVEHGSTDDRRNADDGLSVSIGPMPNGFYVEDDGPGVPVAVRDRAARADFSTVGAGGLGLAIVQAVVRAHGGHLAITDAEGGGARFEITGIDVAPE